MDARAGFVLAHTRGLTAAPRWARPDPCRCDSLCSGNCRHSPGLSCGPGEPRLVPSSVPNSTPGAARVTHTHEHGPTEPDRHHTAAGEGSDDPALPGPAGRDASLPAPAINCDHLALSRLAHSDAAPTAPFINCDHLALPRLAHRYGHTDVCAHIHRDSQIHRDADCYAHAHGANAACHPHPGGHIYTYACLAARAVHPAGRPGWLPGHQRHHTEQLGADEKSQRWRHDRALWRRKAGLVAL